MRLLGFAGLSDDFDSQACWFMLHKFQHSGRQKQEDHEFLAVNGETAKQERAYAALSEDPGLIPSKYIAITTLQARTWCTDIHAVKISTHINERESS